MPDENGGGDSLRASSSSVKSGDRKIFTVDLRPGETTIVSWKKLMKDANKVNVLPVPSPEPPVIAHPGLETRIAPVQALANEVKDEPAPHRFSAVIEKIERLYMGKDSSDDEGPNDIPDDDQYDTEDSFIDDAELDEYFEVDNSAIKHDGFFINRGKLERISSEPPIFPNQQPKKRRRKYLEKGNSENNDGCFQNKHKSVKVEAAMFATPLGKNSATSAQTVAVTGEGMKYQNQPNASGVGTKKKIPDSKMMLDTSFLHVLNGSTSALAEVKDNDRQKTLFLSKDPSSRFKDLNVSYDASQLKYHDRSAYAQPKSQSVRPLSTVKELESTTRIREKSGMPQLLDLNTVERKYKTPTMKSSHAHKKDGSNARPKSSMLEKAIWELEKMVAESRPPYVENQEADNLSQAVKRRLPTEIKLKLARVARLAASHGKIPKELINRLMSILGHIIQLRTLKRNLKIMINTSQSAKQEKDNKFQQIKKDIVEMIKMWSPSLEPMAFEQQAEASDDNQEITAEGKEAFERKFIMDATVEDKICDLYDLYVDGLDEDVGPQARKLYAELAALWPSGFMNNHGIKHAICRAKDRRRALHNRNKDQEKIRRKKFLIPKMEETVRAEVSSNVLTQYIQARLATESCDHDSMNKQVSSTAAAGHMSDPANVPSFNRPKQDKFKGSSSNSLDDARVGDGTLKKKKVKRKPEGNMDETFFGGEKLPSQQQGEERHKSFTQAVSLPHKSNLQSNELQVSMSNSQANMNLLN